LEFGGTKGEEGRKQIIGEVKQRGMDGEEESKSFCCCFWWLLRFPLGLSWIVSFFLFELWRVRFLVEIILFFEKLFCSWSNFLIVSPPPHPPQNVNVCVDKKKRCNKAKN